MPPPSVDASKDSLFVGALHTLLVGTPRIPTHPYSDFPTPLSKLIVMSLCGLQLFVYLVCAVGGVTLWALTQWQGWDDPLKDSLLLSFTLEGWCVIGMALGLTILLMSRRWAVSSGVEWGRMGIRLGLIVLAVLFGTYLFGGLEEDINISLITSVCLFIPALLFWELGTRTIHAVKALTHEQFKVRQKHLLQGENLIFLSYRREDSLAWTDRIADDLKEHFGEKAVFQDVDAIPPGVNFREHLQKQLQQCLVMLVVIGPDWVMAQDDRGNRRLAQVQDCVRLEIEIALKRKIPLIPLLVEHAKMPAQKMLPESIKEFPFQNGLAIRGNPDFRGDMNCLIRSLESYVT